MSGLDQPPGRRDQVPGPPAAEGGVGFAAPPPSAPPKKSPIGRVAVLIAVAAALLGAIFIKFILPLVMVGTAGEFLDTAFGDPYMRLPGDVRAGFEQRLTAALGDTLDDQTDAERTARLQALVKGGLPRLDDGQVDSNFRLTSKAIGAVDEVSCAAVSRAIVRGSEPPAEPATAMINTFSDAELQQWFEIRIAAIEAELRGSPDQVVVSDDEVAPLYDQLFEIMTASDIETIGQLADGATVEDEALCTAVRGLYASVLTLSPEDTTLFARYDVSP